MEQKPVWIDDYVRGEGEVPGSTLHTPNLRVCVHRHINFPGKWLMSCRELKVDGRFLRAQTLAEGKEEAVNYLSILIDDYAKELAIQRLK